MTISSKFKNSYPLLSKGKSPALEEQYDILTEKSKIQSLLAGAKSHSDLQKILLDLTYVEGSVSSETDVPKPKNFFSQVLEL